MRVAPLLAVLVFTTARVASAQGPRAPESSTTVSGVVFDSLAMHGLPGATVQIADATGKTWTSTKETDGAGRFEFTDVPIGTYLLGFFHPKLDSLALSGPTLRVDVRTEQPMVARLATPSARTIVRSVCGPSSVKDSTGLIMGYVRAAENSMPRSNGVVSVRWTEFIIEKRSIHRELPSATAPTSPGGLFAICGVPVSTPIVLQAASAADSSGAFEVTIPPAGLLHRDVFVAAFTRTQVAVSDSAPAVDMLRGDGRLRGRVVGTNGRPVAGARLMLWGTGLEATSDADGGFSLANLPGGTHTLEARAVGFTPAEVPVDIVQGAPGATEVELMNFGITLDTVRVTGQRLYTSAHEREFERRLRTGVGHVISAAEIEKRRPQVLTDLLRTVPGVMVLPGQRSGEDVFMRGGQAILGSGFCRPDFWIDGVRVSNDELFPVNSMVSTGEIRALEVYAHSALVPADLASVSGCGVIVVWTGARRK